MNPTPASQDQEVFELLDALKSIRAEYPPELLVKRPRPPGRPAA